MKALEADLIIQNCAELLTVRNGTGRPKTGKALGDIGLIKNGAVAVSRGKIIWVGESADLGRHVRAGRKTKIIDADGKIVMPGFVDPHTHLIFAGSREREWLERLAGRDYLRVLKSGGGILSTVNLTRKATRTELVRAGLKRLNRMLENGTTTVESKSGYGLTIKDEIKILDSMRALMLIQPVEIVPTFLGAHAVPPEFGNSRSYARFVADRMVPEVARRGLADYCDVFCEDGAFSASDAAIVLESAMKNGLQTKMHVNEFNDLGGTKVAAALHPKSLDHLDVISARTMSDVRRSGSVAVLLPGVAFFLGREAYPQANKFISNGVPVALGTDFNPGTCFCYSMQFIISLSCIKMGLNAEQAINCATINAAHAIGRADRLGSIEVGKQADFVIMEISTYRQIPYSVAANNVSLVVKNGAVALDRTRLF